MLELENLDKLHEECGVIGAYLNDADADAAKFIYYGLYALQHRGQESAGIASNLNGKITPIKSPGLVSEVFRNHHELEKLKGNIGLPILMIKVIPETL